MHHFFTDGVLKERKLAETRTLWFRTGPKKHEGNETKYACCPNRGLRDFIIVRGV